jgi:hypothetical protein
MRYLPILLLAGCGPTIALNFNQPLPNLQTVNTGNPNCQFDCTQNHTATQSIGPGDVTGAQVSTNRSGDTSGHTLGATK